jgi:hypothetical protein
MLMGSSVFYPHRGASIGSPSLKGIAYATLAHVLTTMESAELIPMSVSSAAGVMIHDLDGSNTAALFSDGTSTRSFIVERDGQYVGMDYLGNSLTWEARDQMITVQMSREPIYVFGITEDFCEAPFLGFELFPALVSPGGSVSGSVRVRNLLSKKLEGTLDIVSADSEISFDGLLVVQPGAEVLVPFTLKAGALGRGEHLVKVSLVREGSELASGEHSFASEGVARGIPLVEHSFQLDADGAEWKSVPAEVADTADKVGLGRPPVGYYDPTTWQGPSDLSFSVKTAWKPEDGIYFYIAVRDDHFKPVRAEDVQRAYLQDTLEFFFDGRALSDQTAVYSPGVEQIAVVPPLSVEVAPALIHRYGRFDPMVIIDAVGKQTEDGYVLEGRIRPNSEASFQLKAGTRIGMDFVFDDGKEHELSRKTQMALHGSSRNNVDSSEFGRYYLMDQATKAAVNLIQNTDFQTDEAGEVLDWGFETDSEEDDVVPRVGIEDGVPALSIQLQDAKNAQGGWWVQTMPISGGSAYEVAFKLKGKREGSVSWASGGAGAFFLDENGKWLDWEYLASLPGSDEWGSYNARLLAPDAAVTMGFRFTLSGEDIEDTVKFYCSQLSITEVNATN